ncbi:MAG: SufS family cysteine desulfurase [Vulcanimicrobiaceae bacterium]
MALSAPSDVKLARLRADFPIFAQRTSRGKPLIYLDSAATSQKPRVVIDALADYYATSNANAHRGVYELAERSTEAFEAARENVARFIGAQPRELIWTRNATEAINLVANAWGRANLRRGDAILLTQLEHHSNLVPWQRIAQEVGAQLRFIPIDGMGEHVLDDLDALLDGVRMVALAHVSNTLGTIAPLETIVKRAHAHGALVLADGAQAAPHLAVNVAELGVDFYAISGHKMLAPTGIGALYGKRTLLEEMPPFLSGGDMIKSVSYEQTSYNDPPWKFEAGTSSIADAIAFGVAVDYLRAVDMSWVREHERRLVAYALARLDPLRSRGLVIYGPKNPDRISGVLSFNLGDIHAHDLASILDTDGICIRAGHHCTMPLMNLMGWSATARASFYLYNNEDDVDALYRSLERAAGIFKL